MTYKVLVTDADLPDFNIDREIRSVAAEVVFASSTDERGLVDEASTAAVLVVDQAHIGEAVIASASHGGCRAIVRCGIGFDNIDIDSAERHGIPVANVPDYCLDEVADHTIALLLSHARRIVEASDSVRAGNWTIPRHQVPRLAGRVLGLVGMGRIGRRVAARALAFGLVVHAYDPIVTVDIAGVTSLSSLLELLETADYISLHVPLSGATRHIINRTALGAMSQKPALINTSRGELVDTEAVADALDAGLLSGVALDVFEDEPLPEEHPLRSNPKAIITPHMAYYSNESESDLISRVGEEVARALRGEPLVNPLTRIRTRSA